MEFEIAMPDKLIFFVSVFVIKVKLKLFPRYILEMSCWSGGPMMILYSLVTCRLGANEGFYNNLPGILDIIIDWRLAIILSIALLSTMQVGSIVHNSVWSVFFHHF